MATSRSSAARVVEVHAVISIPAPLETIEDDATLIVPLQKHRGASIRHRQLVVRIRVYNRNVNPFDVEGLADGDADCRPTPDFELGLAFHFCHLELAATSKVTFLTRQKPEEARTRGEAIVLGFVNDTGSRVHDERLMTEAAHVDERNRLHRAVG